MGPFLELRIYKVNSGKMKEWLTLMEEVIIPFQVSKGMVIHGSFTETSYDVFSLKNGSRKMDSHKNRDIYVWIRRFENIDHKDKLYKEVYESKEWINDIGPKVAKLIDRNSISIHNLNPTDLSIMR